MKKLLAVLLLLWSSSVFSTDILVADSIGYKMTLTDEHCRVAHIVPQIPDRLKGDILHGRVEFKDEARGNRELCYTALETTYYVEDEQGLVGHVPKDAFVPVTEI